MHPGIFDIGSLDTPQDAASAQRGYAALAELGIALDLLPSPLPMRRGPVNAATWSEAAREVANQGGRLISLWANDRRTGQTRNGAGKASGTLMVSAAYALHDGLVWLDLPLTGTLADTLGYPDISGLFPCAGRIQRSIADLFGIRCSDFEDKRPWLNHGAWPTGFFPLRRDAAPPTEAGEVADYPFVRVTGDGVHEIAVGPVHAGIIEPGHFRFSVVGEKVLRLEERLGYVHKGVDRRFTQIPASSGHKLAGRISGDSTVAYAWAYCMALESIRNQTPPPRATWLRALLLERERVANHLGDLGALGNDVAFGLGLAHFMRLKEDWLRLNKALFGHRFMMDSVLPGGVSTDPDAGALTQLVEQCDAIEHEVLALRAIYDDHAGLQDRFLTAGRLTGEQARQLNLTGLAARASGLPIDLRADLPHAPYDELRCRRMIHAGGDVAARVAVRFDEVLESLRLIRGLIRALPAGGVFVPPGLEATKGSAAGWIEGWRGEVFVMLETDGEQIRRCHCHDPSWQNWPALEHAVIGNIVPDFPLINKSFNLSYSGHDR